MTNQNIYLGFSRHLTFTCVWIKIEGGCTGRYEHGTRQESIPI